MQVDHAPGRTPSPLALEALAGVMQDVGSTVSFEVRSGDSTWGENLTREQVKDLHHQLYRADARTWLDGNGTLVLHVLYLAGGDADQQGTTVTHGITIRDLPLIGMFPDTLPTRAFPRVNIGVPGDGREGFERTILIHEYGHKLGLVGCGLPEVEAHGADCHSTLQSSVMWPSPQASQSPLQWALDDNMQPVWRFDDADWADIRAFQATLDVESQGTRPSSSAGPLGVEFKSRRTK